MIRSGIAAVTLLLWLLAWLRFPISWRPAIIGSGFVYALVLTLFVGATKLTTAANAIFLQSTAPLYLVVLAPFVLRERVRRADLIVLGAAAAGMVACFLGVYEPTRTAPNPALGNLLGAASGLTWALTLVVLRKIGRDDTTGSGTVASIVIGNAVACAVAALFAFPLPAAPVAQWATLIYLGVFQIGVAYVFLSAAIRRLPALEISLLLLLEPVLNPVWAWIIRGENPGRLTILGGATIIAATAAKMLFDSKRASVMERA